MAIITVKTATVRENGESVLKARVYRGSAKVWESDLRGNGYSSKSAYDSAINSLSNYITENRQEGDTLKIEKHLNSDLSLNCIEI